MDSYQFFGNASTIAGFVPVIAGIIFYKKQTTSQRLFLVYLILSTLLDASTLFVDDTETRLWMYHIYSLTEIVFVCWFIGTGIKNKKLKSAVPGILLLVAIFWLYCHFIYETSELEYSTLFDGVTCVLISSLAAYRLLIMTQEELNITSSPDFWFLTGIFIYFFTANFLFGLLQTEFLKKIWFLHNILNIMSCVIFAKAFHAISKQGAIDDRP